MGLLIGYSGFIYYLSDQSSLPTPTLFAHQDKLFHATAYGILGFFAIGYFSRVLTKYRLALIVAFVFSAMYGASDEWHQSFVEGREADVYDWLADMFGAALLLLVANKFRLFKGKKK
ncbi:MAG: teicoplanin resistance protein VanZ [Piscirickettsiaceae bacterium]|nr:MAG: teicoplanin resistance protein VanZ [Piscirickettsiaceae bacterium]